MILPVFLQPVCEKTSTAAGASAAGASAAAAADKSSAEVGEHSPDKRLPCGKVSGRVSLSETRPRKHELVTTEVLLCTSYAGW